MCGSGHMFMYEQKDCKLLYTTAFCPNSLCLCLYVYLCVNPQETGFWFIFHHVPTGPSEGSYSPGYTEHTPMGQFTNNRAHSNFRVSLRMSSSGQMQSAGTWKYQGFQQLTERSLIVVKVTTVDYHNLSKLARHS